MRQGRFVVLVVAVVVAVLAVMQARATQEAPTPVVGTPVNVSECTGEQRSLESLTALASSPAVEAPTPLAATPSGGTEADEATIAKVTEVLRRSIACQNAGDPLRAFGTMTDRLVTELLAQASAPPLDQRLYDLLATPFPLASADQAVIVAVEDVRLQDDGSVTALVTTASPNVKVNWVRFVPEGDSYLIDRIDEVAPPGTPVASPAA